MGAERVLWHQSGVNKHGEPFVQLLIDAEVVCQLTPEESARSCKEYPRSYRGDSEQDAFMFSFMQTKVGLDLPRAIAGYRGLPAVGANHAERRPAIRRERIHCGQISTRTGERTMIVTCTRRMWRTLR